MTFTDLINEELPEPEYMETEIDNFDNIVGGIIKGGITVISAASGQGKSMILSHLAFSLSNKYRIKYISLENGEVMDKKRAVKLYNDNIYNSNTDNIDYISTEIGSDLNQIFSESLVNLDEYDALFIDALDIMIDTAAGDGATMYQQGNGLMKCLFEIVKQFPELAIVITWQMNRSADVNKIDDLNQFSIGTSMGIVRYASHVYGIARLNNVTYLKLLKCRDRKNINCFTNMVEISDELGNLNLNGLKQNISTEEVNNLINGLKIKKM